MDFQDAKLKEISDAQARGSTGTITTKTHTQIAASTEILATSTTRIGCTVYNNTDGAIYLKLGGGTVSSSDFSVKMGAGDYFEAPYRFQGAVTAIKNGATSSGSIFITDVN